MTDLAAGARVGPYVVETLLGRGGMGAVYRAREVALGRAVALKVIAGDLADPEPRARFAAEARAAARVTHANLTTVYTVSLDGPLPFIALELLPGGSLADRLRRGPLPWREAALLGAGIARGLGAAHAAGIVHRDLKPANVMLAADGTPRICDFGLARGARLAGETRLTQEGALLGTYEYMSPEHAEGATAVTAASDLYSLGATLHALVAGRPPFEGRGLELVAKHLRAAPPDLASLVPGVPPALAGLVTRLLAKDPGARPASGEEVARELEAIAEARASNGRSWAPLAVTGGVAAAGIAVAVALASPRSAAPAPIVAPRAAPPPPPRGSPPRGVELPTTPVKEPALKVSTELYDVSCGASGTGVLAADEPATVNVLARVPLASLTIGGVEVVRGEGPRWTHTIDVPVGREVVLSIEAAPARGEKAPPRALRVLRAPPLPAGLRRDGTLFRGFPVFLRELPSGHDVRLVLVPKGPFVGGGGVHGHERRTVEVERAFWISTTEVTCEWFDASGIDRPPKARHEPSYPANFVSHETARRFCEWARLGLPTELEWEKAARGTDGREYPWGEEAGRVAGWRSELKPVASYPLDTSPYGAADMIGNVAEWTADVLPPPPPTGMEHAPPDAVARVLRGGSGGDPKASPKCTHRGARPSTYTSPWTGFRVVLRAP